MKNALIELIQEIETKIKTLPTENDYDLGQATALAIVYGKLKAIADGEQTSNILLEFIKSWYDSVHYANGLLDSWHQDGTAWTEWDTKVYNNLSKVQLEMHSLLFPNNFKKVEPSQQSDAVGCEHKNRRKPVVGWQGYDWCMDCKTHVKQRTI